jgi:hypothetical protein
VESCFVDVGARLLDVDLSVVGSVVGAAGVVVQTVALGLVA